MASYSVQDIAGNDFDKWLDWDGTANASDGSEGSFCLAITEPSLQLPISPSLTAYSETQTTYINPQSFTANSNVDLLSPSHTSSSPETRLSMDSRLSGETLLEPTRPTKKRNLKRKPSQEDTQSIINEQEELNPAAKKRPHNVIEKRYRANLNEKIAELRDSVPSLRVAQKSSKTKDGSKSDDENVDLDGLTPSNKLNKASVLSKAVEYIRHLEFRTTRLEEENRSLRERVETLDKVIQQGGHDAQRATAFTSENIIEEPSLPQSPRSADSPADQRRQSQPVQGLIPLPESWRRFRQNQSQEHYGHIYENRSERTRTRGKLPGRILLGSLATLMVLDGFVESDTGTESREKGLFGIPLELLDGWKFLRSPGLYLTTFAQYCRAGGIFPLMKGFIALTILAFLVFAYLFNSKPTPKQDVEEDAMQSSQIPTPSSPIEVRRQAWSTSMQVLHLPHHNFFPEWMAVTSEWMKCTIRYVFGTQAYRWFTGRTVDAETARIKAWDIAIDAQLAGGDVEVSRSRVVLTNFGSGTLPKTPLRLMLKALHCRLLLWNVGSQTSTSFGLANRTGKFFANREWEKARRVHESLSPQDNNRLPDYLTALLDMECDDVFTEIVLQRAYNLMYDRPTHESADDDMMDVIVEDHAVRSPLDAIAAWRSTLALRKCLELLLHDQDASDLIHEYLSLALCIAPPGSATETRALAAYAVFAYSNRGMYYERVNEMMRNASNISPSSLSVTSMQVPIFIDSSTPYSARADITNCLNCAKSLMILDQTQDSEKALAAFSSFAPLEENVSILTSATTKYTLARLSVSGVLPSTSSTPVSNGLQSMTEAENLSSPTISVNNGLSSIYQDDGTPNQKSRRPSTTSNDTGYESQEDRLHIDMGLATHCSV